ncbi:peptidase [Acidiplasma sp. MBA-1]|nr:peptidase [Acidiplasma sp. MBA-1]
MMNIINYNLYLDFDTEKFTYTCHEKITLEGNEEKLILNSIGHKIKRLAVNGVIRGFKEYKNEQEIVVDGIITSKTQVDIDFTGEIPEKLEGIYLARTPDGFMITTQFEPTGARKFIPCIDNPSYKATFDITIKIDGGLDAVSNMPVETIKEIDGKKEVKFMQTPRMSTYLLYLGIGHFDRKTKKLEDGKEIGLVAPRGRLTQSDYPLEIAKKSIGFYEDYFNIKYPLPKEDLISVPEFAAGAMENWGAITFREIYLNVDSSTSTSVKRSIADVIAHELAHQWFGDLVTMKWWDDLWLNESFATFMSYKAVDKLYPDYDMFSDFLISETSGALAGDSLVNSHPIQVDVKSPDDIAQIFDEISYGKGGSILRMINSFVTDDVFRKGLNLYLENFKYKNAEGSDLWEFIGKVSDLPVREVMESFIKRPGYPYIDASIVDGKLLLKQSRFFLNGKTQKVTWKIPLTLKYENSIKSLIFDASEMFIEDTDKFLKLNDDEAGFYRVLYSDELLKSLVNNLKKLSDRDLWGIANDYYSFLISGKINLNSYLDVIKALSGENRLMVDQEIAGELFILNLILTNNEKLHNFTVELLKNKLDMLGSKEENEEINKSILRGMISYRLAILDHDYAAKIAENINNITSMDPDLRSSVLTAYAIIKNDFDGLHKMLNDFNNDEDKIKVIQAMSWLSGDKNYENVSRLIENHEIKQQDSIRFYTNASMNPEAREYIYENFEDIIYGIQKVFQGSGYASRVVEVAVPFIGLNHLNAIEEKLKGMEFSEISRGIKKGLEYLSIYSELISRSRQ